MKHSQLRRLLFLALSCDLGLFAKQLVNPVAHLLTDAMHIPGGIGTSFSLLFVVLAAAVLDESDNRRFRFHATIMSAVQSLLALALGRVGSMGVLSPVGYIVPGFVIDLALWIFHRILLPERMMLANALGAVAAGLTANGIVFGLRGAPLLLYLLVAATSGTVCGLLGSRIVPRLKRAIHP